MEKARVADTSSGRAAVGKSEGASRSRAAILMAPCGPPRDATLSVKTDSQVPALLRGPMSKTARGAMFEAVACAYLIRHGLREIARNVRAAGAEIDLIMREPGGALVFVEVRARRSPQYGGAAASVNWHKRQHLRRAAMVWLTRWRGPLPACRFDVLAIERNRIDWIRDAFHDQD